MDLFFLTRLSNADTAGVLQTWKTQIGALYSALWQPPLCRSLVDMFVAR